MESILLIQHRDGRRYLMDGGRAPSRPCSEQEKKQWLSQYRLLDQEIDRLIQEEASWRQRALYVDTVDKRQTLARKIEDCISQINQQIDRLADLRQDMERIISLVPDDTLRLLLTYKYIDGLGFEDIADRLHYCWRQIVRKHAHALRLLPLRLLELSL
ncbi:MAG: hypothetical protein HFE86_07010 [Clostridiales bacterium]|nr:hypothetical protein [Clostridiales bacterium]